MSGGDTPGPDRWAGIADRALLDRHRAGDADAFGELFRRHRDRLWAVAVGTLHDPDDAADALQDAMLAAFRHADQFRGEAAVTTWLHRIVVNACLDRARRQRLRAVDPLPAGDRGPAVALDAIAAGEIRLAVRDALATLPIEQRAALVLVDMAGYSVEEAARILDCPTGTVKSRCARGRARLLPLLAGVRTGAVERVEPARAAGRVERTAVSRSPWRRNRATDGDVRSTTASQPPAAGPDPDGR